MNITVYLGASAGTDPALKQAVQELGRWIGESGNALIYGGSRCGLMFAAANRDPRYWDRPDDYVATRDVRRGLGFGFGAERGVSHKVFAGCSESRAGRSH